VPFCESVTLKFPKPKHGYVLAPITLGDHIRKQRLGLGLTQLATATRLGANPWTIRNWEKGRTSVALRYYRKVVEFLGYNPLPEALSRGEAIRRERLARGWSRRRLASISGVDEGTVRRLEADTRNMTKRAYILVCKTLGLDTQNKKTGNH
jgi:transcriptional regulator with XRE-family HTH domain